MHAYVNEIGKGQLAKSVNYKYLHTYTDHLFNERDPYFSEKMGSILLTVKLVLMKFCGLD